MGKDRGEQDYKTIQGGILQGHMQEAAIRYGKTVGWSVVGGATLVIESGDKNEDGDRCGVRHESSVCKHDERTRGRLIW